MGEKSGNDIYELFAPQMVLSESMKVQLRQICIYASVAGIDVLKTADELRECGVLPCPDKVSSKKALMEIYDRIACSF